jgi:hypothetical protein
MKSKATEVAASIVPNNAGVLNRNCISLIRTFLLNLIAQIALGTPVAAQSGQAAERFDGPGPLPKSRCPSF